MTLNPTLKAPSSMRRNGVRTMVMGGQACVYYGAAEFSRDLDLLVLADPANLLCLRRALAELETKPIAVPELELRHLERGLAVHFRSFAAGITGFRIDVMSVLRDREPFEVLWNRRTVIESEGVEIDLLSLADLVRARKTQRDKDWPMLRRLVDRSWFQREGSPEFWLRELRTPELLVAAVEAYPAEAALLADVRDAVAAAMRGDYAAIAADLVSEEGAEREADRVYWQPLKRELEWLRLHRAREAGTDDNP